MKRLAFTLSTSLTLLATLVLVGCNPGETSTGDSSNSSEHSDHDHDHDHAEGHGHAPGPHGGTVVDWGGGAYHVEFTVDHDKQEATVYVLGSDEKTPEPIAAETVLLTINEPQLQTDLLPVPLEGEAEGLSSRFVGTHEGLGTVMEYAGVISAEVDGTPYAGNFAEEAHGDHDHDHDEGHEDDHDH